jgi:hypothetical protein
VYGFGVMVGEAALQKLPMYDSNEVRSALVSFFCAYTCGFDE